MNYLKNDFLGIYQLKFYFILKGGGVFLEIVFFTMAGEGPCRDFYTSISKNTLPPLKNQIKVKLIYTQKIVYK